MAKSTVRFPEEVLDEVQSHIEDGKFTNQSEFQRFATEYVLCEMSDDYSPTVTEFDEILNEVFPQKTTGLDDTRIDEDPSGFLKTASRVRQFANRGDIQTATELIDNRYPPTSPEAMILDDIIKAAQE